jgi:hypothetical protein
MVSYTASSLTWRLCISTRHLIEMHEGEEMIEAVMDFLGDGADVG